MGRLIRRVCHFRSSERTSTVAAMERKNEGEYERVHGRCELDSHADTIVAGKNCTVLHYTSNVCEVMPYSDEYEPVKNVPVVQAATGYTSSNGRSYIIVFNEALSLDHSLINPNQLRHFHTTVQDNPYQEGGMYIESPGGELVLGLESEGTTIFFDTWIPSKEDLLSLPHVVLSSRKTWNPRDIIFPKIDYLRRQEIEERSLSSVVTFSTNYYVSMTNDQPRPIIDTQSRMISMATKKGTSCKSDRDTCGISQGTLAIKNIREEELQPRKTFISKDRHSDASAEDLSERWGISVAQATMTLKATTRRLVRSALMPLARRYRVDRMFEVRRIHGKMATDTMHMKCKSIRGHKYSQVFGNKDFFVEVYPINKKSECGTALELFVDDFGIPDVLIHDGSKEQSQPGTDFQRCIRKHGMKTKVSEPHRPNQNPAEGVIRELRKKWYRTMFRTNCPRRLWCFGLRYIAQIMQRTASNSGRLEGRTPFETLMGETPDISEYMDFGYYDWIVFIEEAGLGEAKIGKFLGIASGIGSLMAYWVLPDTGIPEVRSTVQRLTELLRSKQKQCNNG